MFSRSLILAICIIAFADAVIKTEEEEQRSNFLSYKTTTELVLKTAITLVANSNGLIKDIIIFVPNFILFNQFIKLYRITAEEQLIYISTSSCSCANVEHFNNQNFNNNNNGKILVVDYCENSSMRNGTANANTTNSTIINPSGTILLLKIVENITEFFQEFLPKKNASFKSHFIMLGVISITTEELHAAIELYEIFRPTVTKYNGNFLSLYKFQYSLSINHDHDYDTIKYNDNFNNSLILESPLFSEKSRSNFKAQEFHVAGVEDPNYAYDTNITIVKDSLHNKTTYQLINGFAVEILRVLENAMNFTTILKVAVSWGHLTNNNSWCGMINLILNDQVDLAISSTADRLFRRAVVDFNLPTSEIHLSAFFRKPNAFNSNGIIQPFSTNLWCLILLWILISGCILLIFRYISSKYNLAPHDPDNYNEGTFIWNYIDYFQWTLGSLCLQSYTGYPIQTSFRIVIGIGYLLAVVIFAAYSGNLISFLSVVIEPIKNLNQLLETNFVFNVVDSPLPLAFLKESNNPETRNIYNRRLHDSKSSTLDVVNDLNKGSFVFLVDHMNAYQSLNEAFSITEACQIREIQIPHAIQKQSSMVPKNSTAKRIIDFQILRMIQSGLIFKWKKQYLHSKPNCDLINTQLRDFEGVNIERIILVFHQLLFGICLAFSILLTEIIIHFKWRKQEIVLLR